MPTEPQETQGFLNTLWKQFVQSFVGSAATVLLGLLVAFITGFVDMKKQVSDLTKDMAAIKAQIDERDKTSLAVKLQGAEADGKLQGQISGIEHQHNYLIEQFQGLRNTVEDIKLKK